MLLLLNGDGLDDSLCHGSARGLGPLSGLIGGQTKGLVAFGAHSPLQTLGRSAYGVIWLSPMIGRGQSPLIPIHTRHRDRGRTRGRRREGRRGRTDDRGRGMKGVCVRNGKEGEGRGEEERGHKGRKGGVVCV